MKSPGGEDEEVALNKIVEPARPLKEEWWHGVERRQWKRKEFSAEATLRVVSRGETSLVSRPERVLVTDISARGVRIQSRFIHLDNLHFAGEMTDDEWLPNLIDMELELPVSPSQKVRFLGTAEWFQRLGTDSYYQIGISIDTLRDGDKKDLHAFLEKEGSVG